MNQIRIHVVPCSLLRVDDAWHVIRSDTGAKVAQAWSRFLAIANAAVLLHTPRSQR